MSDDARRHAPATARNREPILAILREVLPEAGIVLEIASGSGEHCLHFAKALPALTFQPSDPTAESRASTAAWAESAGLANLRAPLDLDASTAAADWALAGISDELSAMLCINMIHISPWEACLGLLDGAAHWLRPPAPLVLYGPYRRDGRHTAASNEAFDLDLRSRDPRWGVRDLRDVERAAGERGLALDHVAEMPANNSCVTFRRCA